MFKMGALRRIQLWALCFLILLSATKASTIKFKADPSKVTTNLTQSTAMRCSLADTQTNDIRHISTIHITRKEQDMNSSIPTWTSTDVASVTPFDAPAALADLGNLEVKGDVSGTSSVGFLELTWKDPSTMAKGQYSCEISTTDASGHAVVFTSALVLEEVAPTVDDLVKELLSSKASMQQCQKDISSQKQRMDTLEQQQAFANTVMQTYQAQIGTQIHRIDAMELKQAQLKRCTAKRIGFMATLNRFQGQQNGQLSEYVAANKPVVFDKIIYSSGGEYNYVTGQFTCTEPGLYYFSVHAMSTHKTYFALDLKLNDQAMTSFYVQDTVSVEVGSLSALLKLKRNDVVSVWTGPSYAAQFYEDTYNIVQPNVFTGHMVHRDACLDRP